MSFTLYVSLRHVSNDDRFGHANTLRINVFEAKFAKIICVVWAQFCIVSAQCGAKSVFMIDHETGKGDLGAWFVENGNTHEEYLY